MISKIEERLERVAAKERPVLPSELLEKKRLYFQRRDHDQARHRAGGRCLLWASDFPHEATVLVKEHFDRSDLRQQAKKKTIYDNAKRFYRL